MTTDIGQIAYEAYCNKTNWKSLISGAPLPAYSQLKPEIQEAWTAAAEAVGYRAQQSPFISRDDMRTITSHLVDPKPDVIAERVHSGDLGKQLFITVIDLPGHGGANHAYSIDGMDTGTNPSASVGGVRIRASNCVLFFQNGPITEVGVNGVTHEALIAILIDRLDGFQRGPYKCGDNEGALCALRVAQDVLQRRTRKRMARGVEGTHTV